MNTNPNTTVLTAIYQEIANLKQTETVNRITLNCRYDQFHDLEDGQGLILRAIKDMEWFSSFVFPIESNLPDPVKMQVVQMEAGCQQHGNCSFTVHIEYTNSYTEKEILTTVRNHTFCQFTVNHIYQEAFDREHFIRLLDGLMPYFEEHLNPDKQQLILDNC